jgi:hypothetical protein
MIGVVLVGGEGDVLGLVLVLSTRRVTVSTVVGDGVCRVTLIVDVISDLHSSV